MEEFTLNIVPSVVTENEDEILKSGKRLSEASEKHNLEKEPTDENVLETLRELQEMNNGKIEIGDVITICAVAHTMRMFCVSNFVEEMIKEKKWN